MITKCLYHVTNAVVCIQQNAIAGMISVVVCLLVNGKPLGLWCYMGMASKQVNEQRVKDTLQAHVPNAGSKRVPYKTGHRVL